MTAFRYGGINYNYATGEREVRIYSPETYVRELRGDLAYSIDIDTYGKDFTKRNVVRKDGTRGNDVGWVK